MKNSTPDPFGITPEARSLAQAVLDNDPTAAYALADWVMEQTNGRPVGRFSVGYVEKLEDALREVKRVALRLSLGASKTDWDHLYRIVFQCEQFAKAVGREGPA